MDDKILFTICVRGGSKGVRGKNARIIGGKPLLAHSIITARETGLMNHMVISTDSDELMTIAKNYGIEVFFKRPEELATDTAAKLPVIRHAVIEGEKHFLTQFDVIIDLDATSPLRTPVDIIEAYEQFKHDRNDILITGTPARRSPYFNLVEIENGNVILSKKSNQPIYRRQDAPKCYDMNASIYIWKRDVLFEKDTLFTNNTGIYVMPEERSIDIDSELDFEIVKMLLEKRSQC